MNRIINLKSCFLIIILLAVSVTLRVTALDIRPFHNDEGVNYHFINQVFSLGYYPYSHENYHGPSYFYLLSLFRYFWGTGDYQMRLTSALAGIGVLFLLVPLAIHKSKELFIWSILLIGTSTSMVYISRYAIHEMLFIFFGLAFGLGIYYYYLSKHKKYLYLISIGLAGIIATKETFIITGFCVFLAWLVLLLDLLLKRIRLFYHFEKDALDTLLDHSLHLSMASLLCVVLIAACYTAGFRWLEGINELAKGVPQWIGRNSSDTGHFKPFIYYISMCIGPWFASITDFITGQDLRPSRWNVYGTEPVLALLIFLVPYTIYSFCKDKDDFSKKYSFFFFSLIWFISATVVYCSLNYKTAWLVINITCPACLCLAATLELLKIKHSVKIITATIIFTISIGFSIYFNFVDSYGDNNPHAYVHTSKGMLDFVKDVEEYRQKKPDARIMIASKGYWPLPYYLKGDGIRVGYYRDQSNPKQALEHDVVVLNKAEAVPDPEMSSSKWIKKYYRFSAAQEVDAYFKNNY